MSLYSSRVVAQVARIRASRKKFHTLFTSRLLLLSVEDLLIWFSDLLLLDFSGLDSALVETDAALLSIGFIYLFG